MGQTQSRGRPVYYAYVSDEKVEMLRGSIPRQIRERIAVELKLDLKIVSASLSAKPTLEDRYQQARVVAEYLRNEDLVGSIEEPNEYFAGTMLMHWGPYGGYGDSSMVFFAGEQDDVCVGLGGSMRHAIGVGTAETMHSASAHARHSGGV